jgi:hypothetical protein
MSRLGRAADLARCLRENQQYTRDNDKRCHDRADEITSLLYPNVRASQVG